MDVHKASVYVCLMKVLGAEVVQEVRTFGTTTRALLELLDWLMSEGCASAAMESTGVYWKPVFNILEGALNVVLINAQHCRGLPGRKTDVKDCEWIAELHMHGLVRPSFIPAPEIRELRDLVRTRTTLIADRSRQVNWVQKVLEDANIKLGNVATDVLGVSGRLMIERLIAGETDAKILATLARGRMRSKRPALQDALEGRVKAHHRLLLKTVFTQVGWAASRSQEGRTGHRA
jgi:transposase